MGCDIHIVVEVKSNGKWLGVATDRGIRTLNAVADTSTVTVGCTYPEVGSRNYEFFAQLNDVRGIRTEQFHKPEQGVPADCSPLTHMVWGDGSDWHNAASMSLHEFTKRWIHSWPWLAGKVAELRLNNKEYELRSIYDLAACGFQISDLYDQERYDHGKTNPPYMSFEEYCQTQVRVIFWFDN